MLSAFPATVKVEEVSLETARRLVKDGFESFVGHPDACRVYGELLQVTVPMNRVSVQLGFSEVSLVGQYSGPRLPEGATMLPEGANIRWLVVTT
jgi:hypothetical protein